MNRNLLLFFLLFFSSGILFAQGPKVPSRIEFAGMDLKITDAARRTIQSDVDALHRSRRYLDQKLERVNMYFPIIERIFREEGLPEDFKYLVIQESALVSDAVSTSNAVGFWQFKKESAEEVGLRISGPVDERKNIVSATRGAARYLKRNNNYFDNWVYALLSYHQGAGGAMKLADKRYYGSDKYTISKDDHWYILKFLAHKIAYQEELYRSEPRYELVEYTRGAGKTLKDISRETGLDDNTVEDYNKWLSRGKVPEDKVYAVILPMRDKTPRVIADVSRPPASAVPAAGTTISQSKFGKDDPGAFPKLEGYDARAAATKSVRVVVNGRDGVVAGPGASLESLTTLGDISESKFLRYNDMSATTPIEAGQVYYFKKKRGKAQVYNHVVLPGETWWSISQKYGIRESSLLRKNREREPLPLKTGRVLWMRFTRPSSEPVTYRNIEAVKVENVGEETKPVNKPVLNQVTEDSELEERSIEEKTPVKKPATAYEEVTTEVDTTLAQQPAGGNPEKEDMADLTINSTSEDMQNTENSMFKQEKKDTLVASENDVRWVDIPDSEPEKILNSVEKHTVEPGETLFGVSRKYSVTVDELMAWNNLPDHNIKPGQVLTVQAPAAVDDAPAKSPKSHIVGPGETLYGIARRYGITLQQLMEANNMKEFDVREGQQLNIPQ